MKDLENISLKIEKTNLDGVLKIHLENFHDDRGTIINLLDYHPNKLKYSLDKLTITKKNVLRGLHGDKFNDKLIYCLRGEMKFAVVNLDESHEQFLKSEIFHIKDSDYCAIFVPRKYLNAHYCIGEEVLFFYRWTYGYVEPQKQMSYRWNSKKFNINWGNIEPSLSERDNNSKIWSCND
jgi:dTDP-4-dehydrorhamnose 3,5-epimerase